MSVVVFAGTDTPGAWGALLRACLPTHSGLQKGVELKPCGTVAALQRHYRRGEDRCPACALAGRIAGRIAQQAARERELAWRERATGVARRT